MPANSLDKRFVQTLVREKRESLGLSQRAFALLVGLKDSGERTVRGWEAGEHVPTPAKLKQIEALDLDAKYALDEKIPSSFYKFRFIDLFAGIGGIRMAFQDEQGQCVFSSEWDRFAQRTYTKNYADMPYGDITVFPTDEIPDHDILLGGFPCQAFSQAGLKKGFNDTRGTMFFEIQRILRDKRPKAFMLENVKQLKGHDGGKTLATILDILQGNNSKSVPDDLELSRETREALSSRLDYWVDYKVLNAKDYGLPQNRERIFLVGFDKKSFPAKTKFEDIFHWPVADEKPTKLGNILEPEINIDPKYTISEKLWAGHKRRKKEHGEKGNGFGYCLFNRDSEYTSTISARYYKDGSEILIDQSIIGKRPRKLTPRECARLQGFPEEFDVSAVSDVQIYKQFGNSVAVPVVRAVAKQMVKALQFSRARKERPVERQKRIRFHATEKS